MEIKSMKKYKYLVISALAFICGCTAAEKTGQQQILYSVKPAVPPKVRILVPWENGYKLQSIVFYQDSISSSSILFTASKKDYPVAIYPLRDEAGNLLTIWDNSRGYKIRMYGAVDGKISQLFEDDSKTFPELIFEKKEMENFSIVITNTDLVKNKKTKSKDELPVTASIYRWKDGQYVKSAAVPWTKRFSAGK
jgi:hypothetical protein